MNIAKLSAATAVDISTLPLVLKLRHTDALNGHLTVEVYTLDKSLAPVELFTANAIRAFKEGIADDENELLQLILGKAELTSVSPSQAIASVHRMSRFRLNYLFTELGEPTDATILCERWNQLVTVFQSDKDYIAVFVRISD